jgi:hypothetical protein
MIGDVTGDLNPRSPRRLLEDLAQLARVLAARGRARPEVELYLASGQVVKGRLAAFGDGDDRSGPIAVVIVGGTPRAPATAYVRIDQVVAVTVGDGGLLLRPATVDAPAPSRVELQRQAAACGEGLAARLGHAVPVQLASELDHDDDGRRAVAAWLPVVFEVLGDIAGDELGRLALGAIAVLELGAGPIVELWREPPDRLVLRAPRSSAETLTVATLRPALERLL